MKRAWVFDDEAIIRESIGIVLAEQGYSVSTYESPVFAQESEAPDLVVSDNRMPHLTGMEYVRRLYHNGGKVRHIALMSGDWDRNDVCEAEAMGCKIFYKPFSMGSLRCWLATLAGKAESDSTWGWTNVAP